MAWLLLALALETHQKNEIELFPPGGCVTLDVGRSVITFPVFWEEPLAYKLLETPLPAFGSCEAFFPFSAVSALPFEVAADDPTTCITFSFSFWGCFDSFAENVDEHNKVSKRGLGITKWWFGTYSLAKANPAAPTIFLPVRSLLEKLSFCRPCRHSGFRSFRTPCWWWSDPEVQDTGENNVKVRGGNLMKEKD